MSCLTYRLFFSQNMAQALEQVETIYEQIRSGDKTTSPILSKFEKTRALCIRAQQLANGSPSTLDKIPGGIRSVSAIAEEEFHQKKLPIIIRRIHPSGKHEDWKIHDLTDLT